MLTVSLPPADVDIAMQLGAGMKSGPLHTADLVGHDVNLAIMETLYHETGDPKYRPHPLMRQMVRAGWLGVKTGKGFFEYDGPFGKGDRQVNTVFLLNFTQQKKTALHNAQQSFSFVIIFSRAFLSILHKQPHMSLLQTTKLLKSYGFSTLNAL